MLLLVRVAELFELGALDPNSILSKSADTKVADSGIWQHLSVKNLSVSDLAIFVGAFSDNWATNVLLRSVQITSVNEVAARLELDSFRMLDEVRDVRVLDDEPYLSHGTMRDIATLMTKISSDECLHPGVGRQVATWLSLGMDLSMVAGAFGLDPLSHAMPDRGVSLFNKTGTDPGVRVDTGVVDCGRGAIAYACAVNWLEADIVSRDRLLDAMNQIGSAIRVFASS